MKKYLLYSYFLLAVLTAVLLNDSFPVSVSASDRAAFTLYGDSKFQQKAKNTRSYSINSRPVSTTVKTPIPERKKALSGHTDRHKTSQKRRYSGYPERHVPETPFLFCQRL